MAPGRVAGDPSSEACSTSIASVGETVTWKGTGESEGADEAEGGTGKTFLAAVVVVMVVEVGSPAPLGSEGGAGPGKAEGPDDG